MTQRRTIQHVKNIVGRANDVLETVNSPYRLVIGQRYSYIAIDLGYADDKTRISRTMRAGMTKTEAHDYVEAMLDGIELYTR